MKNFVAMVVVCCSVAMAAAQTGTSAPKPETTRSKPSGMMQGGMQGGMMDHCKMHCRETMSAMNTLAKQVEEARQSNDPAKMRAALDAVAKHHGEMREHMQTCMKNMQSGGATPQQHGSQGSEHQHQQGAGTPRK